MTRPPEKSGSAFRTIREVADWLGVPTHVLRFWESKFEQIAPVKGAGGRRYYRPEDMRLLGGIKVMLHDDGLTIRAVSQRIEESGVESIMDLSPAPEAGDTTPPQRTRRVIRKGDDLSAKPSEETRAKPEAPPPKQTAEAASGGSEPAAVRIAKDPATPLDETLPDQPDVTTDLPDGSPDPGEPLKEAPAPLPSEVPLDRSMPDDPPVDLDSAPSDPSDEDRHAPGPLVAPPPDSLPEEVLPSEPVELFRRKAPAPATPDPTTRDGAGREPVADPGAQTAPDAIYPLSRARAHAGLFVQGGHALSAMDRKRLRRIVRRYRALAEEIADDLADGASD